MDQTKQADNASKRDAALVISLDDGPALIDRSYRSLLEVTGGDRATWLHNLTSNYVKTLQSGQGNYAFALNVQGRILFDLNILMCDDRIWIDLDRQFLDTAVAHFEKYIITEDVTLASRADAFGRIALVGQGACDVLAHLGLTNALAMPVLDHTSIEWKGHIVVLCRTDPFGSRGFDLWIPRNAVDGFVKMLSARSVVRVENDRAEARRIEAGIAWPGSEIRDDVLPGETGQFERAVGINKGCYLGQEVVERMRSREVIARRLVGLRISGEGVLSDRAELRDSQGSVVGIITSSCRSDAVGSVIALAYVKTAHAEPRTELTLTVEGKNTVATVSALPFVPVSAG